MVTRVSRTRSGEPDPVHAIVIGAVEAATARLDVTLRGHLRTAEPQES